MQYLLKNDFYTVTVNEVGAEAVSIKRKDGTELLWHAPDGSGWQMQAPFLFPICSRLKDKTYFCDGKPYQMDLHGFLKDTPLMLIHHDDTTLHMSLEACEQTLAQYPFLWKFDVEYKLSDDKISINVTIENRDKRELPFMFGWHPGFILPTSEGQDIEDYEIEFGTDMLGLYGQETRPNASEYPIPGGSYKICEKEIYDRDTLIFGKHHNYARLFSKGYPYLLEMKWSENMPYYCVWKAPQHKQKFLCLEPWSDIPVHKGDGYEQMETKPMTRLPVGEKATYFMQIRFNN